MTRLHAPAHRRWPARAGRSRRGLTAVAALVALATPVAGRAQALERSGFVEVDHFQYFRPAAPGQVSQRGQMNVQLDARLQVGPHLRLVGAGEMRAHYSDRARGSGYVNEAFADLLLGPLDLRVGKQVIAWGTVDVFNPTDNLTPTDFTDPLDTDDQRLGGVAARARLPIGRVQLEAVLLPVFTASRLPTVGSRWYPPLATTMPHPLDAERTVALAYDVPAPRTPASTLDNMQYAARASTTVQGWDVSLSYFDGWDDLPATEQRAELLDDARARVTVLQQYPRRRAIGGDLATTIGPYSVRAEAAYLMPGALAGPDHFYYAAGVERFFGDPMAAGTTMVLTEWVEQLAPHDYEPSPFDLNHVFRKTLATRVQHNATTKLRLTAEGIYDVAVRGYYVHPGASYQLLEGLRLEASLDVLGGREASFFSAFAGNRRLQTTVRYSF